MGRSSGERKEGNITHGAARQSDQAHRRGSVTQCAGPQQAAASNEKSLLGDLDRERDDTIRLVAAH